MKIAVIGAGHIGNTLGKKWSTAGYAVYYGVREPGNPKYSHLWESGEVYNIHRAIETAKVVLLSIPGDAVTEFVETCQDSLEGKLIIDATNNIRGGPMNNLELLYEKTQNTQLIRAFSTLGWENFENPVINGQQVDLFFCGHSGARAVAEKLISDIGLRPIYLGPLEKADLVDGLTRIWFELVFEQAHSRRLMLKMVEKD
ncbi:MAG: NAD(P)-binding domain-containing protein [Anaerolineaceae bacterium]|nr:NAD(P)-binding domain-containing protein [Anaerolineaceae bacterium]